MVDETTTTSGDEATATGTTTKRRPWEGKFAALRSRGSGGSSGSDGTGGGHSFNFDVNKARTAVGRLLWAVGALFALILAAAVLLIAIDANADNELVRWIIFRADDVDLGFFDLGDPIKDWDRTKGQIDDVKTALFNYGIAAIIWLIAGKAAEKIVRP